MHLQMCLCVRVYSCSAKDSELSEALHLQALLFPGMWITPGTHLYPIVTTPPLPSAAASQKKSAILWWVGTPLQQGKEIPLS